MIKKGKTIILIIVMLLTMLPTIVIANVTNYNLWVNGIQVNSSNAADVLDNDSVHYDVSTNTLTLNNAEIDRFYTSSDHYTSGIYANGDINITLIGDNNITVSGGMIAAGIHANGVIKISGPGSLNLTVSEGSSETRAIATGYTDQKAGVIIDSGTLHIDADGTSGIYAVYVDSSYETVLPERFFKINGGTVEMDANSVSPYSCYATNIQPDLSDYEGHTATAILNSWEVLQKYDANSWGYYRYIKVQPLAYDENGISEDKEHYQPAVLADDNYYEIQNAGNLFWFAEKLLESEDNGALNARLISNITMPADLNWVAMKVGTSGIPYNGIFDGNGYAISNLHAELESGVYSNEGLFKTIGKNGIVKNLGMINASIKPSSGGAGAICGTNHGLIENCYNQGGEISIASIYGGGIAGENDGIIRQCYNSGSVESTFTYGSSIGGIAGYSHDGSIISDCYNIGDITGAWYVGGICGELNGGTVQNCYGIGTAKATTPGYGSTADFIVGGRLGNSKVENSYYISSKSNNAGGKTKEQFASGEVAYLLNDGRTDTVWGQTLGTEDYPQLKGLAVYAGYEYCYSQSIAYSNDPAKVHEVKPSHHFEKLVYDATSHWYECTNANCNEINGKEEHKGGTATYFSKAICEVCKQEYGDLLVDTSAPTGKISVGTEEWTEFYDAITYETFFDETQWVEISAYDDSYDMAGYSEDKKAVIEYYLYEGDAVLTKADLDKVQFTAYTGKFSITPNHKIVIYVKISDHAGNSTYISSQGIVLDDAPPVIQGISDHATYYTSQAVTVVDNHIASITLNGQVVKTDFKLIGDVDVTYTIIAKDKAGNSTTAVVTMKPIASIENSFEDITVNTVTSKDEEKLNIVLNTVIECLQENDITMKEKDALDVIHKKIDSLLVLLDKAEEMSTTDNIQRVEDIDADNVSLVDKENLVKAKNDLEYALQIFGKNYTNEEREILDHQLNQINTALKSVEKVETLQNKLNQLPSKVEPDDILMEEMIYDVKEQLEALSKYENTLILDASKVKLNNLLDDLLDYRIIEGNGSQWKVGTNDSVVMVANGAFAKWKDILVDGKSLSPSDYTIRSGSTIVTLKSEYLSTLSTGKHTLTVVYFDGKTSGEFEILNSSQNDELQTAIRIHDSQWMITLFLASCGFITFVAARFKKASK